MKHRIQLMIKGRGVSPETVSIGELAEVLNGLEAAVHSYAQTSRDSLDADDKLSLVGIFDSSEGLTLMTPQSLLPAFVDFSIAISNEDFVRLPREAHRHLSSLSQLMERRGWDLEFGEDQVQGIVGTRFGTSRVVSPPSPSPRIRGTTTLVARCLRVGGVRPRVELRLANRERLLYADVSEDLAKQLAGRLYEKVGLEGSATWDPDTWQIEEFRISRVTQYRKTDPFLAFKELSESAGGRWEDVDGSSYVLALRADD